MMGSLTQPTRKALILLQELLLSEDDPHPANAVRQIEDVITIAKSF